MIPILAPHLQPGDTVGIVSPSFGGAGLFPHRTEQGVPALQQLGLQVKFGEHALHHQGYVSDTAENRAYDLHQLFADPTVKAIIAAIGGDHSCHLLSHLDFNLIRQNPKILMGFSDITVLNVAVWVQTGLVTFNGPALLTDFAEYPQMLDYTRHWVQKTLFQAQPPGIIQPAPTWTEEFLDWEQKLDLERPRRMLPSDGWTWLKSGQAQGTLVGGCIESLQHLRETRFWPNLKGAILFFETSEEKPSPADLDGILMDYENMGVLAALNGMLFGRPIYYSEEEKRLAREIILTRTQSYNFPIITDMDFGHTSPQFILPIGCQAEMDSQVQRFEILTPAVS